MEKMFQGIMPAMVTPYDIKGRINPDMIGRLVEYGLGAGVVGFYICGSTGEGLLLSVEERKLVAEETVRCVRGRGSVVVHVGAVDTAASCDLAYHAGKCGADAIASIAGIYYNLDETAIVEHFKAIGKAGGLPLWIYHIPTLSRMKTTLSLFDRCIQEIPAFSGIKYSDKDLELLNWLACTVKNNIVFMYGKDQLLLPGLIMGAHGGIGLNYNYMPKIFVSLYRKYISGDIKGAREDQYKINQILGIMKKYDSMRCIKSVMRFIGFDCGGFRRPLRGLTCEEEDILYSELTAANFFECISDI